MEGCIYIHTNTNKYMKKEDFYEHVHINLLQSDIYIFV